MQYESIPEWTAREIEAVLTQDDPSQLYFVPIAAALYSADPLWAESVCLRLAQHPDASVRGNALLGLGHIARIHRRLTQALAQPVVERALQDAHSFVRGQAESAADDIELFLQWRLQRPYRE